MRIVAGVHGMARYRRSGLDRSWRHKIDAMYPSNAQLLLAKRQSRARVAAVPNIPCNEDVAIVWMRDDNHGRSPAKASGALVYAWVRK